MLLIMENKKLGVVIIIIALVVGSLLFYYNSKLNEQAEEIGCFSNPNCATIEDGLSISHIAIGIFSFILALGFYLLFFNRTEKKIMEKLENAKEEEKFDFALKMLNSFEARVLKKIKEHEGITQSTLRIKTDMSKAKLSYVLQDLEKRKIIKRIKKGKTFSIYLNL